MTNPLMQCIERERAMADTLGSLYTKAARTRKRLELTAARAATDEAVRTIEAEINSLRQQNWATQPPALTHEHLRFLRVLDDVNRLDDDDHEKLRAIANILAASLTSLEEQQQ